MPRLIDADKLRTIRSIQSGDFNSIETIQKWIDDAPTVDAEPVKHGEWIPKITELGTMIFRCSACQKFSNLHWAYCPQCGAKMDGERREDDT